MMRTRGRRAPRCPWGWSRTRSRRRSPARSWRSPRTVGVHPDTGKPILAGVGRYGSWLRHGRAYVSLPDDEDVLTVGLNPRRHAGGH